MFLFFRRQWEILLLWPADTEIPEGKSFLVGLLPMLEKLGPLWIAAFPLTWIHLFFTVCHKHGEAPACSGEDRQGRNPVCGQHQRWDGRAVSLLCSAAGGQGAGRPLLQVRWSSLAQAETVCVDSLSFEAEPLDFSEAFFSFCFFSGKCCTVRGMSAKIMLREIPQKMYWGH